ncbi:MAG: MBL fold metallo-hydrolase [Chloroflexi bacterium]|nr:MBL fold metallo-hydrolase [Chloroflexota bacterium]
MQLWSFASGSDGNCYLVESEGTAVMVECGRPYQQIKDCLARVGIEPDALSGVLLTHAHGDHSRSARSLSREFNVPIYASRGTLAALGFQEQEHTRARPMDSGKTVSIGQMDVTPFAVPHDCNEPFGFRLESGTGRTCVTTDLGWVPASVARQFRDLDLLVLEANYDPYLLETGTYPVFLKRRVAGTYGHLSNQAAAHAIAACGDRAPRSVWLAHLSEQNNSPKHALQTVFRVLKRRGLTHISLKTTLHRRANLHWTSAVARERQLQLFSV